MSVTLKYIRSESNFNTLINQTLDFCSLMESSEKNTFGQWIISFLDKNLARKHFHPCPYQRETMTVDPVIQNIVLENMLKGTYAVGFKFYNSKDPNAMTINVKFELR